MAPLLQNRPVSRLDLPLHLLNGETLKLSKFKNTVVVLVFGSYSTPAFRDKATAFEEDCPSDTVAARNF